jgi:hypothetical protein
MPELSGGSPAHGLPDRGPQPDLVTDSGDAVAHFCGVRLVGWPHVKYVTGEERLYNEAADPYEMNNLAATSHPPVNWHAMRARIVTLCSPPPSSTP